MRDVIQTWVSEVDHASLRLPFGGDVHVIKADLSDIGLLSKYRWRIKRDKHGKLYVITTDNGRHQQLHRILMMAPPHLLVDHLDSDGLNNRRDNLRLCTHAQNRANSKMRCDSRSRFKGVHFHEPTGKWRAQIRVTNKYKHIGYFNRDVDAAIAYNEAALKEFGEFAKLNVIPQEEMFYD